MRVSGNRGHTGSYAFPQELWHTRLRQFSRLTYAQQQKLNLPSLGDKLLASGTCPVQKDTVDGLSCQLEKKERLNLMRHFWDKLMEIGQWRINVNDMGPITFLNIGTSKSPTRLQYFGRLQMRSLKSLSKEAILPDRQIYTHGCG